MCLVKCNLENIQIKGQRAKAAVVSTETRIFPSCVQQDTLLKGLHKAYRTFLLSTGLLRLTETGGKSAGLPNASPF